MAMMLSVYTENAFREIRLPIQNNSDFALKLYQNVFGLAKDVTLNLEVINEEWKFATGADYSVYKGNDSYEGKVLKDEDVLSVYTENEVISVVVKSVEQSFYSFRKFSLAGQKRITIGKKETNDICYDYAGLVSREHAVLERTGEGMVICNKSANGIYVNSKRVNEKQRLRFGDYVSIIGLHFVYLGEVLALDTRDASVKISSALKEYIPEETGGKVSEAAGHKTEKDARILLHRAPRNIEKIETEAVSIEPPPGLNQTKKQPLIMTIGPSFTMALPMLLGCFLMTRGSSGSGISMYSGLVMAVSSAAVGVVWALFSLRIQKKTEREEELHRFEAYGRYLQQKSEEVKGKYENNIQAMNSMYESSSECLKYIENQKKLWNRNPRHADFLYPRLGIGNQPFQVEIACAPKKFTLHEDSLEEKPRLIQENFRTLFDVPICVNLLENRLIGIVGGAYLRGAIEVVKNLTVQIAANNCYTDVKMIYIYDGSVSSNLNRFDFAKWLPHVWSEDKKIRYVAADKNESSEIFYELTKVFRHREETGSAKEEGTKKPHFVLFLVNSELMEGELISKYIFDMQHYYGLTTFILSEQVESLPNFCEVIIENDEDFQGIYNISAQKENKTAIAFDEISDEEVDAFARELSNYYVKEVETGGDIPGALTFFDMFDAKKLEDLQVLDRWRKNRTYENIRGIIGQKAGGAPCYLDLHEKYHGPHGLVAGTTGSGKSETLQTYMLSLAINYSPDDIGYFIIDYKGGGMANLFNGLPHLIGQISNLSGNQVHRAMVSIKSENRRRQRVFNEYGVNNINLYTKLYKNKEASLPIPHLFIIIDEFAELKREEPDFMRELISVAQVGRSLGVHLILATQKPSGTVDDNIWSNSKFRLCLRVQDRQDSMDMLHKPDAAYITQAGRCYLQVGNDEVFELFQSGYSGAAYEEEEGESKTDIATIYTLNGKVDMAGSYAKISRKEKVLCDWLTVVRENLLEALEHLHTTAEECCRKKQQMMAVVGEMYRCFGKNHVDYPESTYNTARLEDFIRLYEAVEEGENQIYQMMKTAALRNIKLPQAKEKTQLDAVTEYLAKVAKENGYTHELQLWMPVLPEKLYLEEFEEYRKSAWKNGSWAAPEEGFELEVVMGRLDDPQNQAQMPLHLNFAEEGHLAIYGTVISGKSTSVQTITYALLTKYSPAHLWFYGIDFSSKMLSAFEAAPHCGGMMYEGDYEKISKFFVMIMDMLKERKKILKGGNFSQYAQIHGMVLPAVLVIIDNFAAFNEKTAEAYLDDMIVLSKEGVSHGIYLLLTGGGIAMADIPSRLAENVKQNLTLELQDKFAYTDVLHNMKIEVLPESGVKGRGLADTGNQILEYQTALALEASDDYQRLERISDVCEAMAAAWKEKAAKKIPEIPEKPVWSEFHMLEDYRSLLGRRDSLPVGYRKADAMLYALNLSELYCYLITGMPRSGKKNFLKVVLQAALEKEAEVCIIDGPAGYLKGYQESGVKAYASEEEEIFQYFGDLLPEFVRRNKIKNELVAQDAEESEIFERLSEEMPIFIFISEFAWFVDMVYRSELDMRGFLENIVEKGRLHNIYFIAEMKLEEMLDISHQELYRLFVGYKTGIHFGGNVAENRIFNFDSIPYQLQGEVLKPGIGYTAGIMSTDVEQVVVPMAKR
ncbi:MAG: type VII secretion protein EssC [Roseburia sp.]|nr:type VII secretion protein EssC [Roseburia sp.]